MFYVGQKVLCIDDKFDPSIVEWADHVPEEGRVYTIRAVSNAPDHATRVLGLGFNLLELQNPKTSRGGEVCFSAWRFEPIVDSTIIEALESNERIIYEERGESVVGPAYLHIGSRNQSGRLTDEDVETIVCMLITAGNIPLELLRVEGRYKGRPEQALKVMMVSIDFIAAYNAIQRIRVEMGQDAIGLQNKDGLYARITEDAVLCLGPTYVVCGHSAVRKSGVDFDPSDLGFYAFKDYWIATGPRRGETIEIGSLPRKLSRYLESWEAFSFYPGDDITRSCPEWIASALGVNDECALVWHPNPRITETTGPYLQQLIRR